VLRHGGKKLRDRLFADFGQHAMHKSIPSWLLWGDEKLIPLLLRGMFRGDGHVQKDGQKFSYSTISPDLAYGAVMLLDRMGVPSSVKVQVITRPKTGTHPSYYISVAGSHLRGMPDILPDLPAMPDRKGSDQYPDRGDGGLYRQVTETERYSYSGMVYNLHVADTNNYVVPAGTVANCIPIDPNYLSHVVRRDLGYPFRFVELAQEINNSMPAYVVSRAAELLNQVSLPLKGSNVLLLGVTYKPDIADQREATAPYIARRLIASGAKVYYDDPYVPEWAVDGHDIPKWFGGVVVDLAIMLQPHREFALREISAGVFGEQVLDTSGKVPASPIVTAL
jgi:hypothetical protein